MRGLSLLVTLGLVLAAAQAIATVLALLIMGAIVYGAFAYPRQTFALLGFGLACSLVERQPLACLAVLMVLATGALVATKKDARESLDGDG